MSIPGQDLLAQVENSTDTPTLAVKLGMYLRNYLQPAIENVAQNAAVWTSSQVPAPDPPQAVNVATSGELMQVTVNHDTPIQKGVHYITHIATNPQMTNAIILDHGASRCPPHINLPTKDASGNTHNYYVATVAQYPGSQPSNPTFYGGASPKAVTMGGSTQMDIQPGSGSGTAANGGQTLVGLGKSQVRISQGVKRGS